MHARAILRREHEALPALCRGHVRTRGQRHGVPAVPERGIGRHARGVARGQLHGVWRRVLSRRWRLHPVPSWDRLRRAQCGAVRVRRGGDCAHVHRVHAGSSPHHKRLGGCGARGCSRGRARAAGYHARKPVGRQAPGLARRNRRRRRAAAACRRGRVSESRPLLAAGVCKQCRQQGARVCDLYRGFQVPIAVSVPRARA